MPFTLGRGSYSFICNKHGRDDQRYIAVCRAGLRGPYPLENHTCFEHRSTYWDALNTPHHARIPTFSNTLHPTKSGYSRYNSIHITKHHTHPSWSGANYVVKVVNKLSCHMLNKTMSHQISSHSPINSSWPPPELELRIKIKNNTPVLPTSTAGYNKYTGFWFGPSAPNCVM